MTADGVHHYFYDAENRLIQVDGTQGSCSTATACYLYGPDGRRTQKTVGSTVTNYLYDLSGNTVGEQQAGSWVADYAYLGGSLVAEYKSNTTYFAHGDHLGSTRLLTSVTGTVQQNLDFLPFGEILSTDSGVTTHKFTGDERDSETALDHSWFRKYSSQLGRWTTPDPASLSAASPAFPQSWNRYSYVLNAPTDSLTPSA